MKKQGRTGCCGRRGVSRTGPSAPSRLAGHRRSRGRGVRGGGYEIGRPSLWRDEAYTKDAIGRPVSQIFALLGHQDAVHGAYYILMHVIVAAVGTSATALAVPFAVRHGHPDRVHGRDRPPGRRPGAGARLQRRPPERASAGISGADRAAVRPGVRDRALHDLLRPDGQVIRDRDDVRLDRHLPAAPGLSRRPLAVVVGVRGSRGADRPVQHLRAADPGRARRDAAADRGPRPVRTRTPDGPDPAALAGRRGGRGDRAQPAARRHPPGSRRQIAWLRGPASR